MCDLSDQPTDKAERAAEGTFQHSKTYCHVRTSGSIFEKFWQFIGIKENAIRICRLGSLEDGPTHYKEILITHCYTDF